MSEEYEFNHKIVGYVSAIIGLITLPVFVVLCKPSDVAFVPVLSAFVGFMFHLTALTLWWIYTICVGVGKAAVFVANNPKEVFSPLLWLIKACLKACFWLGLIGVGFYLLCELCAWVASGGVIAILLFLILISRL